MAQQRIRAVFMRGGTSKGLIFRAEDLPADRADWAPIFLAAMGSPDPNGRQLDGMGAGASSTSKVCVVGEPTHPEADVDYTFAQISVDEAVVDYAGNCGNMSSAIGPFAVDEGLVPTPADGEAVVRIHNTNTGKVIASRFAVRDGLAVTEGDFALDGVSGTAAPIRLDFLDPGGAKTGKLLPTGNATDTITVEDLGAITVSLVDAGNPFVFVAASDLDLTGTEMPKELANNKKITRILEEIRQHASIKMGLSADLPAAAAMVSIPKIAILSAPQTAPTLSGQTLQAADCDILSRTVSVGQPHNAIPLTGALCLAAALRVEGSVAHRLAAQKGEGKQIRIGHPSGTMSVDAETVEEGGVLKVLHATVFRTARRLFSGEVYFRR